MKTKNNQTKNQEPTRQLSPWRIALALILLTGLGIGIFLGLSRWKDAKATDNFKPFFASYVDVTATPYFAFEQLGATSAKNVVLSFIVSSKNDPCLPTWGTAYDMNQASDELDLDRRIARLRQQGGDIIISFGGLINDELARNCTDPKKLQMAYESVIDRYNLDTIDLDIEGEDLKDINSLKRRANVLAKLQKSKRAENKNLAIWLTLPVAPQGLTQDGTTAVKEFLNAGVDLAGLNVMTMDYGASKETNISMAQASKKALNETHRQLGILYEQVGLKLTSPTIWIKIGATPMIGQNDVVEEVFTIEDATILNKFAHQKGLGRMSMWSANRDIKCSDNYVDTRVVSDSCSGVKQEKQNYLEKLSEGFEGQLYKNAKVVTKNDPQAGKEIIDDPKTSPYQIWKKSARYLENTKVVWHGNVYQAKWWTQGDLPDNPVLQSWETPWQLLGPVLPNERPVPIPTLPPGTYTDWSKITEYTGGQRVLYQGIAYQAKWWTKGDNPANSLENPDSSPWITLTQEQIKEILKSS